MASGRSKRHSPKALLPDAAKLAAGDACSKCRHTSGFTLVEVLAAVAVLALLAVMFGTALSTAVGVYHQSSFVSQAGVFEDTADSALGSLFRYSKVTGDTSAANPAISCASKGFEDAVVSSSVLAGFTDSSTASGGKSTMDGYIYIYPKAGASAKGTPEKLLNAGAYTGFKVADFTYAVSGGSAAEGYIITGSYNIVSTSSAALTRNVEFTYRTAG